MELEYLAIGNLHVLLWWEATIFLQSTMNWPMFQIIYWLLGGICLENLFGLTKESPMKLLPKMIMSSMLNIIIVMIMALESSLIMVEYTWEVGWNK